MKALKDINKSFVIALLLTEAVVHGCGAGARRCHVRTARQTRHLPAQRLVGADGAARALRATVDEAPRCAVCCK